MCFLPRDGAGCFAPPTFHERRRALPEVVLAPLADAVDQLDFRARPRAPAVPAGPGVTITLARARGSGALQAVFDPARAGHCAKSPTCTRGYQHRGQGGRCNSLGAPAPGYTYPAAYGVGVPGGGGVCAFRTAR